MPRYRPYRCPKCGELHVMGPGVGMIKCKNCGYHFSGGKGSIPLPGGYMGWEKKNEVQEMWR